MTQTATAPEPQQRMRALERANEVRLKRAWLKRRIADGHLSAAEVILALPDEARNWSVGELLKCQRRWGSIRSQKLLAGLCISEKRPIGELTERQRRLIAERLAVHAPPPQEQQLALVGAQRLIPSGTGFAPAKNRNQTANAASVIPALITSTPSRTK